MRAKQNMLAGLQSDAFDFIALAIGVVATLRPAASVMLPHCRLPRLCHLYAYLGVVLAAVFWAAMYIGVLEELNHQAWYTGGTGTEDQVTCV